MNLLLLRDYDNDVTDGELFDEKGKHICWTLELPWKDNKQEISCIPEGVYKINKFFSGGFNRWIYKINKVLGRDLVRIHNGNTVLDIRGCILVGTKQGTLNVKGKIYPAVLDSVKAMDKLLVLVGSEGMLTIKNRKDYEKEKQGKV